MGNINLVARNKSPYTPGNVTRNGKQLELGMISVGAGSSVDIEFQFQDDDKRDGVMTNFIFTIFGMANSQDQSLGKQVTSSEASRYFRSDGSAVYAAHDFPRDGCVTFMSLQQQKELMSLWASNPHQMTDDQRNEAVAFQFKDVSTF